MIDCDGPWFLVALTELAKTAAVSLKHEKERALAMHIAQFPETLVETIEELAPNRLTEYLYFLTDNFNSFYTECKVRAMCDGGRSEAGVIVVLEGHQHRDHFGAAGCSWSPVRPQAVRIIAAFH